MIYIDNEMFLFQIKKCHNILQIEWNEIFF